MLTNEFKYYLDHQAELVEKYIGKFLIIKDEEVQASYDDHIEAYYAAEEKFGLGNFLLQHCLPGEMSTSRTFNSQVILSE